MGNSSFGTARRDEEKPSLEKLINDRAALLTDQEPSHPEIDDRP
jgi:hypothetical protein